MQRRCSYGRGNSPGTPREQFPPKMKVFLVNVDNQIKSEHERKTNKNAASLCFEASEGDDCRGWDYSVQAILGTVLSMVDQNVMAHLRTALV
jgi:hypothetical protein